MSSTPVKRPLSRLAMSSKVTTSVARANTLFFLVKTQQFDFSLFDFRCVRKYAQFFSSKHSSVIFRDSTSGALANKLYFSRQNTAVLIFHDLSSGALKTQEF